MRINKYIAGCGVCSRRGADKLIQEGKVLVDGKVAELGTDVGPQSSVFVNGEKIEMESQKVLLLFNKPKGIVCTAEKREKDNIIDYIDYPIRIFPVGRLDKDSRGLILLTNEGDLANQLMKARNMHEREYRVTVDSDIGSDFIQKMSQGVYLSELDVTTRPCEVKQLDNNCFSIVLTQGLNRQIRRMCETCGTQVTDLLRIRIENIHLDDLPEGKYRSITNEEKKSLMALLEK